MDLTACVICGSTLTTGARGVTCDRSCRAVLREQRKAVERAANPPAPRTCSAPDCRAKAKARGLCNKHYQRLMLHGDLELHNGPMPEARKRALWRWRAMIRRCTDPTAASYNRYGGRGIKVCERWMDFDLYWGDVGNPSGPSLSLDRIDNDGDYEPGNVRWATPAMQAANRKNRPDSCRRNHPFRPETTYTYPNGSRSCCICNPDRTANPERYPEGLAP